MPTIKFVSLDTQAATVTVTVNDVPLTRTLPVSALGSTEAFDAYMKDYVSGLKIEFPDPVPTIDPSAVSLSAGQIL